MTHIDPIEEDLRQKAWMNQTKGKGIRWRMLRDLIATISTQWLSSYQIETAMIRLWGTKRKSTRDMLQELVGMGDVIQEKDTKEPYHLKFYMNQDRVAFWFGKKGLLAIPAGLVQAVEISKNVRSLEE